MFRKLLEAQIGPLTDYELRKIMSLVTRDIHECHISNGQRTSLNYVVQVASRTHSLLRRNNGVPRFCHRKEQFFKTARSILEGVM